MPITRSAKKKLRQDIKRHKFNTIIKNGVRTAIKKFRKKPSEKQLAATYSQIDKAVKKNIFHPNKAARIKSSLATLIKSKKKQAPERKTTKKK